MMLTETKLFEIRDNGTFISVLAIWLESETDSGRYLLARSGYADNPYPARIVVWRMDGGAGHATSNPYAWTDGRTMSVAHVYIKEHWDEIETGDVIDVEFILGETDIKKISERFSAR